MYEITCNACQKRYDGASQRPAVESLNEHESSFRLRNERTAIGQHYRAAHRKRGDTIQRGKRDIEAFQDNFEIKIIKRCRDGLDAFLYEGLHIKHNKPELNGKTGNGFVDL